MLELDLGWNPDVNLKLILWDSLACKNLYVAIQVFAPLMEESLTQVRKGFIFYMGVVSAAVFKDIFNGRIHRGIVQLFLFLK